MSTIDETENIDTSVHLPRGMSIISEERAAKGDMLIERDEFGHIRFAQMQVRNILNYLWNTDIITDENHDDGHTFEAWRNQHRVATGQQRAISGDPTDPSSSVKLRAYGYILILKRLSIYDYNAVSDAIETFENEHTRFIALSQRMIYRRAFTRLSLILPAIRDQVAYLESLSDDERQSLSDERLKTLLDNLAKNA